MAIAAAVLLAITSLFLWRDSHSLRMQFHPRQSSPALANLRGNFFGSTEDTDIMLADTSFALVQDITEKSFPLGQRSSPIASTDPSVAGMPSSQANLANESGMQLESPVLAAVDLQAQHEAPARLCLRGPASSIHEAGPLSTLAIEF